MTKIIKTLNNKVKFKLRSKVSKQIRNQTSCLARDQFNHQAWENMKRHILIQIVENMCLQISQDFHGKLNNND